MLLQTARRGNWLLWSCDEFDLEYVFSGSAKAATFTWPRKADAMFVVLMIDFLCKRGVGLPRSLTAWQFFKRYKLLVVFLNRGPERVREPKPKGSAPTAKR
jgi:hypothetical protein